MACIVSTTLHYAKDHEIVRALETHPKEVLWNIEIDLCGQGPSSVL